VELAYDDRRWAELPGVEMTREKADALWNRVLQQALVRDGRLGRPSGTIALSTELGPFRSTHLDPDYEPEVAGATIELRDPGVIRDLADKHGQFEYLWLTDPYWYRGLLTVHVSVSRTSAMCEARRARKERGCHRTQTFECRESEDDWICRVSGQSDDACDPSRRLATACD
jgi:hypothetical protein